MNIPLAAAETFRAEAAGKVSRKVNLRCRLTAHWQTRPDISKRGGKASLRRWLMAAATHSVRLLCWLVPWWQHHISAGVSWSRAAGRGVGGRRGAGPADVLLWIMGVAALRGLRAAPQKGVPVSAPRPLTAPALQAGPTPYHACSGWALASCRGNHRWSHSGEHNSKVAFRG